MKLFLTRLFSIFLVNWTDNYDITFRRDVDKAWLHSRFSILSSLSRLCNSVRNSVLILFSSRKKYATLRNAILLEKWFQRTVGILILSFSFFFIIIIIIFIILFYFSIFWIQV